MVIRLATESDIVSLKRLLVQLGYPPHEDATVQEKLDLHQQEGYQLLVGEQDREVIGFIVLHWFHVFHLSGSLGRITAFCVDERFRSQGIGRQLLLAAENVFAAHGCRKIEVTSNILRERTHHFYREQGYLEDSKRFVKYLKAP